MIDRGCKWWAVIAQERITTYRHKVQSSIVGAQIKELAIFTLESLFYRRYGIDKHHNEKSKQFQERCSYEDAQYKLLNGFWVIDQRIDRNVHSGFSLSRYNSSEWRDEATQSQVNDDDSFV